MPTPYSRSSAFTLYRENAKYLLPALPENSVDSVVVDPPYELGFMQRAWDRTGIAFDVDMWRAVLRVLKPGGYLVSFGGTRTYHRMACSVEDAGFEIRDQLVWLFATGFPKSLDIARSIDTEFCTQPGRHYWTAASLPTGAKAQNHDHVCAITEIGLEHAGEGTALKPAHEPIVLARKPFDGRIVDNVLLHGTAGLFIDSCRIEYASDKDREAAHVNALGPVERAKTSKVIFEGGKTTAHFEDTHSALGRFPANVQHSGDGSVVNIFPATAAGSAARYFYCAKASAEDRDEGLDGLLEHTAADRVIRKAGSAGMNSPRAGAGRTAAGKNHHPTVKPTPLMRYLCRLITPPGGIVLDHMMGSGSTGKAAMLEGFGFVGVDLDPERNLMEVARLRIMHAAAVRRATIQP